MRFEYKPEFNIGGNTTVIDQLPLAAGVDYLAGRLVGIYTRGRGVGRTLRIQYETSRRDVSYRTHRPAHCPGPGAPAHHPHGRINQFTRTPRVNMPDGTRDEGEVAITGHAGKILRHTPTVGQSGTSIRQARAARARRGGRMIGPVAEVRHNVRPPRPGLDQPPLRRPPAPGDRAPCRRARGTRPRRGRTRRRQYGGGRRLRGDGGGVGRCCCVLFVGV